nr:hypothetical protein CFP56_21128 [Quercus suber]
MGCAVALEAPGLYLNRPVQLRAANSLTHIQVHDDGDHLDPSSASLEIISRIIPRLAPSSTISRPMVESERRPGPPL